MEADVNMEQSHAEKTAEQCAKKAVAAVQTGVGHIAAHAENSTDAGKSGVSVERPVKQRAKRCGCCGFDIALPDMEAERFVFASHDTSPVIVLVFCVEIVPSFFFSANMFLEKTLTNSKQK